ncbi:MAG: C4-dicarboxylate ABC transporter substrate-binding protein [Cobetia sp.]|jgi:TRAP-type mannitol/chloroaromatic compound transport system permease small subunit|uniref:TRAP transporter small permease subunit n=1 Tax=unclassified Cobetia TaxID=2609414 RepID=UPI000C45AB4B|nr:MULTISPECIES: TRAP transporter small permease subunit [unclassified Cobetia]MBF08701.1 C4-dicarboxylate ABC transporter substrate-binding protein [Cobetia sp.]MBK08659.1 C4-dicarboxylate ABC transporter substrate-binding protein [Cobetia sp.]MBS4155360.1 TRAP transporter small permease subunit [Cobetia sp. MC34]HBJ26877.1 C4-dicarboxylate ABC transporter substrate-binding protein [Cobetia sp.]|tara:strand:+ start:41391 stop:41906 length:516 start_codon:yes stop_codon:yes gene_type:complete
MKIVAVIERQTRWAGYLGAVLILPLVLALVYEVFSRYVLGKPTLWAFEISYMVMGAIFMLGMANALRVGQHVSVDVLSQNFAPRLRARVHLACYVVLLPVLMWLVWELWLYALEAFFSNERSGRSAWNPVIWPVFGVWWLGFVYLTLQVAAEILKLWSTLLGHGPGPEVSS